MIEMIQDHDFGKLSSIGHAFFTRQGGISKGKYHALNCAVDSLDDAQSVLDNRQRAMAHLSFSLNALVSVNNVHGNQVALIEQMGDQQKTDADAMVTKLKKVVLASDSADCPIVLFADKQAEIIGLAHAGWKGAKLGIVEKTVEKMIFLGANQDNICAVVSPCITQNSYEVSEEFYQQFLAERHNNEVYFIQSKKQGHFLFDLLNYVQDKLRRLSLKSVTAIGLDTYSNEELFFSCRRAYHQGETDFGGQLSCVYLK